MRLPGTEGNQLGGLESEFQLRDQILEKRRVRAMGGGGGCVGGDDEGCVCVEMVGGGDEASENEGGDGEVVRASTRVSG